MNKSKPQTNWWNLKAPMYDWIRSLPGLSWILNAENTAAIKLLEEIPMTQETVILDIGTGDGNVIRLFPGSQKMQIIGMDASKSMLMEAKRKFPGNGYILGVPVQDDTIDVITCIGLSEYVAELTSLLKEIRRVVKPGGRILFTISPKSVFTYLRSLAGVKVHARAPAQVKSLLAEHGFEIQGKSHTLMQVQYLLSIN